MEIKPIIIGTCATKCPGSEVKMRETEGLLHLFEIQKTEQRIKRPRCILQNMVKEYTRPAAGQEEADPATLRPVPVLHETIDFLYTCIVGKVNTSWTSIYDYVFDRLRAVRQDMVMQDIQGYDAIDLLEKIVRFYIFMVYRMGVKITPSFDPTINNQHTQECLKRLLALYKEVDGPHRNQLEFESIYLMFNLGDTEALNHYLDLAPTIRKSLLLRAAYNASINYLLGNYIKCLRQITKLPCVLCLCAAQRHLSKLQQKGLYMMCVAYNSKNCKFPSWKIEELLAFNSQDETEDVCQNCGLLVKDGDICFQKTQFKQEDKVSWRPWQILENLLNRKNLTNLLLGTSQRNSFPDISTLTLTTK